MATILFVCVLYVLAVARVTRLLTADKVTAWWRNWLVLKLGTDSMFVYAWFCRWCLGLWVSFVLAPVPFLLTDLSWWLLPFLALSASHVTGLLVKAEPNE